MRVNNVRGGGIGGGGGDKVACSDLGGKRQRAVKSANWISP